MTAAGSLGIAGDLVIEVLLSGAAGVGKTALAAYVANIYTKLGVDNRAAATRYALEHGLA